MLYYRVLFLLSAEHKYSLSDLDNLYPYERDLYVHMLNEHMEAKAKQSKSGGSAIYDSGTIGDI